MTDQVRNIDLLNKIKNLIYNQKTNLLIILLAIINMGFVGEYFSLVKFRKANEISENRQLIQLLKNDRNYYQGLYNDCGNKFNLLYLEIIKLQSQENKIK